MKSLGTALVCAGAALAGVLVAPAAGAQEREDVLQSRHKMYESPQHWAAELRFGPYYPDIDSDPALGTSTACTAAGTATQPEKPAAAAFGTSDRLMIGAEFDWQALRIPHLGTFGPAVQIGYTQLSGNATFLMPHNTASGSKTCTSGESTSLQIVPINVIGVLRADALWREYRIPLVPYLKAGLGDALWRASNTLGTSSADGVTGEGHSYGFVVAAGIGLNLNLFDEYAAKNFDETVGVNNTYLFFEYMWASYDGLGLQSDPLRVGDTTWTAGLAWEF